LCGECDKDLDDEESNMHQNHDEKGRFEFVNGVGENAGSKTKKPYLRITSGPCAGKYVHTLIMEAMLGRELEPWEQVEHKDGDGLNDRWTNLLLTTDEAHPALTKARIRRERSAA
jgi:hypothetical protein